MAPGVVVVASMSKPIYVDSLGRTSQDVMPSYGKLRAILLPQAAYRNIIDFLQLDTTFCNHAIPTFYPMGWVSLSFNQQRQDVRCDSQKPPAVTYAEARVGSEKAEDGDTDNWLSQFDAHVDGALDYDWDEDKIFLSSRERRRRRKQSKKSVSTNA